MSGLLRHSLTRIVPSVKSQVTQKATNVVAGPPKNPMPFMEKLALGGTMCVVILTPMFYIISNVSYYKNPSGASAE